MPCDQRDARMSNANGRMAGWVGGGHYRASLVLAHCRMPRARTRCEKRFQMMGVSALLASAKSARASGSVRHQRKSKTRARPERLMGLGGRVRCGRWSAASLSCQKGTRQKGQPERLLVLFLTSVSCASSSRMRASCSPMTALKTFAFSSSISACEFCESASCTSSLVICTAYR